MDLDITTVLKERFVHLSEPELIEEIKAAGKIETLETGEILLDVGERITHLPLVLEGSIKIMREDGDGKEMFLYYVESGNTCAASLTCCMNKHKSNIMAVVEEKATFLVIPTEKMDDWMSKYRSWREFILMNYALRFEELMDVVDLLAFKKMDDRILNYLEEKAILHNSNTIEASHQDIAYDLNTSREVVSRILKQMERQNVVSLSRGKIVLNQTLV